jgi:hypothetical protein
MNELLITPRTKVIDLIETYPRLEDVLIEYAPAFKKIKNPVLRKTVARIATLQQASVVAGVNVEELVNRLRKEVGQNIYSVEAGSRYNTRKPDWFEKDRVVAEFDAKELLDAGQQPVGQVIADLKELGEGKIYLLLAPFLPAPLIDKATSLGIEHWIDKESEEKYRVYFYNP